MADYKESTITGKSWQRCYRVVINNPYNEQKTIAFLEEELVQIGGKTVTTLLPSLDEVFNDPSKVINIVDPQTNVPTGTTITYGEVYAILHSAYIQNALARDAAASPQPEPTPEPNPAP